MFAIVAILLFVAVIAAIFGFTGLLMGAAAIAKALLWVFLLLFLAALVVSLVTRGGAGAVDS